MVQSRKAKVLKPRRLPVATRRQPRRHGTQMQLPSVSRMAKPLAAKVGERMVLAPLLWQQCHHPQMPRAAPKAIGATTYLEA